MTVEALKEAIVQLSELERYELFGWCDEMRYDSWDLEMQRDFSPGGSRAHLLESVKDRVRAGQFTSLDEGLSSPAAQKIPK